MLSCVCRPVNSSLPKPPLAMAPQKRPSIVVTCEPRIATATIVTKKVNLRFKSTNILCSNCTNFRLLCFLSIFLCLCDFSSNILFFLYRDCRKI